MPRFVVAEEGHVVSITPPIDINGAGACGDWFSMEHYDHASIILTLGVTGAAANVILQTSTSDGGTATQLNPIHYYAETTAAGDTLGSRTATTSGWATSTNDGIIYVIELDAEELPDGSPWVCVGISDPSAATLYSGVAVLSGGRHQSASPPTAIA